MDYYFMTPEIFEQHRSHGDFLECFEVFGRGYWYGTLESEVTPRLNAGKWVALEIDVQGATAIRSRYPEVTTIFVGPASVEELERRLRLRGTESEDAIRRRLEVARRELDLADDYQYHVVNDDLDRAVAEVCAILLG